MHHHCVTTFDFASPISTDGFTIHQLIANCPPLDTNSLYCNLLQADHFNDTCLKASNEKGELVGFVSGYIHPKQPNCLFVWQIAIDSSARGQGLAVRLLERLLQQPACKDVEWIHTTITPDNQPSQKLFQSLAAKLACPINKQDYFLQDQHFANQHQSEELYLVGPFKSASSVKEESL